MIAIDTTRKDLCEEFKKIPIGRHSPDLQKLLLRLRWGNARGRSIIVCTVIDRQWRLGRMGKRRGEPVEIDWNRAFDRYEDAVWACFRERWREVTGQECPVT
jgi:hypothetical protein